MFVCFCFYFLLLCFVLYFTVVLCKLEEEGVYRYELLFVSFVILKTWLY